MKAYFMDIMATGGNEDGGRDRVPRNLNALLQSFVELAKDQDEPSTMVPMTDERRQFLADAFHDLEAHDPIKVMLEDIKVILEPGETDDDKQKKERALDDLQMHVEDMDLANDFYKIGGYALFNQLLNSSHSGFRWRTADLIATLAQNNPYSQQCLLDAGVFPSLIKMLEKDEDETARVKAMYAISCLCREFPPARESFLNQYDGFSVLVRAIQSDIDKIQTKASFMLAALCTEMPEYKETLVQMGLLEQLIGMLHQPHSACHEHLMRTLLLLCEGNIQSQAECQRPELGLCQLLKQRLELLDGKEEYQEEYDHATKLQQIVFQGQPGEIER